MLPGGKVGCFRSLVEHAQSDDEFAAVMRHEVGHVDARYAAECTSQQVALDLGVSLAAAALSGVTRRALPERLAPARSMASSCLIRACESLRPTASASC